VEIGGGNFPTYEWLLREWSERVGLDIKAQIQKYESDHAKNPKGKGMTPYQFGKIR
jgi:hypothetical protein